MSATTPLWVPLTVAVGGLVTTLGAAVLTQWLANRRERTDREAQWRRDDSIRWHQDRKQAYAELIAALYAWDGWLEAAGTEYQLARIEDRRPELDVTERTQVAKKADEALVVVEFMASEKVRQLALASVQERRHAGWLVTFKKHNPDEPAEQRWSTAAWRKIVANNTSALREAMRKELRLESTLDDLKLLEGN